MDNIQDFIRKTPWANSKFEALHGDASPRKYYRLSSDTSSVILMDSKECIELINPFINISNYLRKYGFSSPEIYEIDHSSGYILLEDFGDNTFYKFIQEKPNEIGKIYKTALDLLLAFKEIPDENICSKYDSVFLIKELSYFIDWYCPYVGISLSDQQKVCFYEIWNQILDNIQKTTSNYVFVHKDFHGGNLLVLPNRKGYKSIGLIDFQSAKFGNELYDLISFLYDCRVTVPAQLQENLKNYYFRNSGIDSHGLATSFKIFIVQRNLKILGNFSKIYLTRSNNNYLKYIPNVWNLIKHNIDIEQLKDLKQWLNVFSKS